MDTKLQIRLDSNLKEAVTEIAKAQGETLSQVIRALLTAYVQSDGQMSVLGTSTQVPVVSLTELSAQVSALNSDVKQVFGLLLEALRPIKELCERLSRQNDRGEK